MWVGSTGRLSGDGKKRNRLVKGTLVRKRASISGVPCWLWWHKGADTARGNGWRRRRRTKTPRVASSSRTSEPTRSTAAKWAKTKKCNLCEFGTEKSVPLLNFLFPAAKRGQGCCSGSIRVGSYNKPEDEGHGEADTTTPAKNNLQDVFKVSTYTVCP